MNQTREFELVELLDDDLTDDGEAIGITFASGIHQGDLVTYLERTSGLAGEVS
jgi:hypothetical protein